MDHKETDVWTGNITMLRVTIPSEAGAKIEKTIQSL